MRPVQATPALSELMSGYLHQDYDLVGTIEDNVDSFIEDFPELAAGLPAEVTAVLSATEDDTELAELLTTLGCQIRPPNGGTYRGWLTEIAERVRRQL